MVAATVASGESSPSADDGRARRLAVGAFALTIALALVLAWSNRWVSDDGFINVRVVENVLDGRGPVFNPGERVEVGTSPAWIAVLAVGSVLLPRDQIGTVAVVVGLASYLAAIVLAVVVALRSQTWSASRPERLGDLVGRSIPFGVVGFVVLPPAIDFATSGLEGSLGLLWLAGCQWALLEVARGPARSRLVLASAVIGLGPLVRPDFAVVTLVFGLAALVLARPLSWRRVGAMTVAAVALPAAYELFRLAYFGSLLPNTALAKEASESNWSQGLRYLGDLLSPYLLLVPLLLAAVALGSAVRRPGRRRLVVLTTPVVAGLVHGFFVVRGGGDFMHGRMLLPALFLLLLPVAAVERSRTSIALAAALVAWTLVPLAAGGPPYADGEAVVGPDGISDEHAVYTSSHPHPMSAADVEDEYTGTDGMLTVAYGEVFELPLAADVPFDRVLARGSIGAAGMAADDGTYVLDLLGLASPLGARFELLERGRPGHEKVTPIEWAVAMYADPAADLPASVDTRRVQQARAALRCEDVVAILEGPSAALTFDRMRRNIVGAFTDRTVRIHPDPAVAAAC